METLKVLHPVKTVQTEIGSIAVRELCWREAVSFIARIGQHAGSLVGPDGALTLSVERLASVVAETAALAEYLLTQAAGLTPEQISALRPVEALDLLDAAIDLNLSPELFARGKTVAARVSTALGLSSGGSRSTTVSPPNATP